MSTRVIRLSVLTMLLVSQVATAQQPAPSLTITTEPNAIVWIDNVRRGKTDDAGNLSLSPLGRGRHTIRVRAIGFSESIANAPPSGRGNIVVKLLRTSDPVELAFQEAENLREQARTEEARNEAATVYRRVLKARPEFVKARVGLARVLLDLNDTKAALAEIDKARRTRPVYPEASAVEGRIYHEAAFDDEAVKSFRRAIREASGFQPEARVGLARILEEKGQYEEAISEFRKALEQLSDSEPVIYQLLGALYERNQRYKEAVEAYEKYLALAPNGSLAPAIRSVIEQLKRDAAGQEIIP